MRTVYAAQFRVRPTTGQQPSELVGALADRVWWWLGDRYSVDGKKLVPSFDGKAIEPREGHQIVATADAVDGHALISIDWRYPHEPDPTVLWLVHIVIGASGGEVEVAVSIRISSVGFVIRPLDYVLRRPKLLPDLFKRFRCAAGNSMLSNSPKMVGSIDAPAFVDQILRNSKRTLPVVLVSPVVWDDKPLVDSSQLQDELAGLALVAELESKWAAFAFSEAVGPTFTCYNGAVRIYWPGFTGASDDTQEHYLYLPAAIQNSTQKTTLWHANFLGSFQL